MTILYRGLDDDDIDAIVTLLNDGSSEIGLEPTHTRSTFEVELRTPAFQRERMARVAEKDGKVAGYGLVFNHGELMAGTAFVAAEHRRRGIGSSLLAWCVETARAIGPGKTYYTGAPIARPDAIQLLSSFPGARHERSFYRMLHDHPASVPAPVWPEGIELASFEGDALLDKVIEAHDNSFVDHWNFNPMERAELVSFVDHEDYDPGLFFVPTRGDAVAGFALNWIDRRSEVLRGTVGQLGTTRPFRGIGLGRALLLHSLREMAARGAREVELGVDSINPTGAVRLYESVGFTQTHERRVFAIPL